MLKILVLFLILAFVGFRESNATEFNREMHWVEGSAINITVGPEDALYCKLDNSRHINVFEGFGSCRLTLDRVTQDDRGYWHLWYGTPGLVAVQKINFFVNVLETVVDTTPRITSSLKRHASTVSMTCSVPEEYAVSSCTFRDPVGYSYMASTRELQDSRFRSVAKGNNCTLELLEPENEVPFACGIWRCAVHTTQDIKYSFINIPRSILIHDFMAPDDNNWAALRAKNRGMSGIEGGETTLFCSIPAVVRYCYYRSPNGTVINISPSTSSADYEYVGNGFDAGECGIRIKKLLLSDTGDWSCNVGLLNSTQERRDIINVYVQNRTMVYHRWQDNEVVMRLRIFPATKLEYCRFVRNDGLAFTSEQVPVEYNFVSYSMKGNCELHIPRPQAVDLQPWTVVAKVVGEDEVSVKTTIKLEPISTCRTSSTTAIILWSFIGISLIFLIVVSFFPKKNREWTFQRAARIRNCFKRQPHNVSTLRPTYLSNHDTKSPCSQKLNEKLYSLNYCDGKDVSTYFIPNAYQPNSVDK